MLDEILRELKEDVPNESGSRLQKQTRVIDFEGELFTVTVERGDTLNG